MNSLLRTRTLFTALAPSRHLFASTSTFSTSSALAAPPPKSQGAATQLLELVDSVIGNVGEGEMGAEEGKILPRHVPL